ncbi:MAG: serine hydrolase domain-containing protein [Blastocatellia bacterium]
MSAKSSHSYTHVCAYIENLVRDLMDRRHIPGLAIAVILRGQVAFAGGFGVARVGTLQPVTIESVFHMASVTKPFAAAAAMQLVERKKLDLDASVTQYLPYFRLNDTRFDQITVRQLLSHTSGMPEIDDYHWDEPEYDRESLERYVKQLAGLSLVDRPGARFAYSNIGFDVLGDVISKAAGMTFETFMRRSILAPLEMSSSTLLIRKADKTRLVSPHVYDQEGMVVPSEVFPYNRCHAASSTLYSTLDDMDRWALANLNNGRIDGGRRRLLPEAAFGELWRPQADVPASPDFPPGISVCLSWFRVVYKGHVMIGHGGRDVGFQTFLVLVPEENAAITMMTNCGSDDVNILIPLEIIAALLDRTLG